MDDCKQREETDELQRRVSSTGLRHGSSESKCHRSQESAKYRGPSGPGDTGHTESSVERP